MWILIVFFVALALLAVMYFYQQRSGASDFMRRRRYSRTPASTVPLAVPLWNRAGSLRIDNPYVQSVKNRTIIGAR